MKYFTLIFLGLLVISCHSKKEQSTSLETLENNPKETIQSDQMDWLLGHWKRKNGKNDRETYEKWVKKSATSYSGLGYTLQNTDTIFMENIQLLKVKNKWQLNVLTLDSDDEVSFMEAQLDPVSITVENQENEFPKIIKYWKEEMLLMAEVSNSELDILFEFEKID
jgi:hypothetical protein